MHFPPHSTFISSTSCATSKHSSSEDIDQHVPQQACDTVCQRHYTMITRSQCLQLWHCLADVLIKRLVLKLATYPNIQNPYIVVLLLLVKSIHTARALLKSFQLDLAQRKLFFSLPGRFLYVSVFILSTINAQLLSACQERAWPSRPWMFTFSGVCSSWQAPVILYDVFETRATSLVFPASLDLPYATAVALRAKLRLAAVHLPPYRWWRQNSSLRRRPSLRSQNLSWTILIWLARRFSARTSSPWSGSRSSWNDTQYRSSEKYEKLNGHHHQISGWRDITHTSEQAEFMPIAQVSAMSTCETLRLDQCSTNVHGSLFPTRASVLVLPWPRNSQELRRLKTIGWEILFSFWMASSVPNERKLDDGLHMVASRFSPRYEFVLALSAVSCKSDADSHCGSKC